MKFSIYYFFPAASSGDWQLEVGEGANKFTDLEKYHGFGGKTAKLKNLAIKW